MKHPIWRSAAVAGLALTLAGTAACSGKSTGGEGADGVKTGPGVTGDKISVTALTDLTGPYGALGKGVTNAQKLYFDQLNASGGVCDRKIDFVVRDHGYDVQKAIAAYSETAPSTAVFPQVIGSPITMALKQRIETDKVLAIPQAWAHTMLGSEFIQVTGTTYDIDMINAVAFLVKEHGLTEGDKIGHLILEGDYGQSALVGSKFAAKRHKLTVVEQQVKATDQDMTAQAGTFRRQGVKAVLVSASPPQAASLVGVAAASGLNVPMVGSNSAFAVQLLETPVAPVLQKSYYIAQASAPFAKDVPGLKKLATDYQAVHKGEPLDSAVISGYSTAATVGHALKKACEDKDLSREGIAKAHRAGTLPDLGLGLPEQDFTQWTKPAARATYIVQPDKSVPGSVKVVQESTESEDVKAYQAG